MKILTEANLNDKAKRLEIFFLSNKMADVFEQASKSYDLMDFINKFIFNSDLFFRYFTDETIFSQSKKYIIELFCEEITEKIKFREMYEEDVAYWLGYLFAEWYQNYSFNPRNFTANHLEWLYYGYDTLHTQSIKYVYEVFCEEQLEK